MKIILGTKNKSKTRALSSTIERCLYFDKEKIKILFQSINSGVADMPLSLDEIMAGAKNRADNLKSSGIEGDFYIGMEGGTSIIGDKAYLFGSVYIINASGEGHFGISPMIEVPKEIKHRLYEKGEDLGEIQDEISGVKGIGHKNGSFGEWSDNMITRDSVFEDALICAISPFYNKSY